jgi:phage terminase Nu1 subunit (DNA packaging protein)
VALPNTYDWARVRAALRELDEAFPGFLENVVLIGGGACWFYREALRQWDDPVFPDPAWSEAEEAIWLSKDVDFMGLDREEASDLLQTPFDETSHTFHFRELELDFLEEGLQLTPQRAMLSRRMVQLPELVFYVVEAAQIYAEKTALVQAKERPQDSLHQRLLAEFLKCEFCREVEDHKTLNPARWVARARVVKTTCHDFFETDERLAKRLRSGIARLPESGGSAIRHWAKHHLRA